MTYEEKFELVRKSLITYCKDRITYNWERMFDMWLSCEAQMVFGDAYKDIFKEHFEDYITEELESKLWISANNIVFALGAFMAYKQDIELEDVLKFTEHFVSSQLDDFDNWCDTTEWFNNDTDMFEGHSEDNPQ